MAYKIFDDLSSHTGASDNAPVKLSINGDTVELPDASFVRDADMTRDGMDLVLHGPDGSVVIENYFAAEPAPDLVAPNGDVLTPNLVESFVHGKAEFAAADSATDESPVGHVQEMTGEATVVHPDGTSETLTQGMAIYQGDVIETGADGAVNIVFIDETSFAVSENARLSIDEYVFDPATNEGTTNFSVLKGLFVFTSGLIGREDPDDVQIETPVGSIGIRGTIIMGNVDTGEITVVEGAIVLKDHQGNEVTLAEQFASARFVNGASIEDMGLLNADEVGNRFASVSKVSPTLFSSLQDAATEENVGSEEQPAQDQAPAEEAVEESAVQPAPEPAPAAEALPPAPPAPPVPPPGNNSFTGNSAGLNPLPQPTTTQPEPVRPASGSDNTTGGQSAANNPPPPPPPTDNGNQSTTPPLTVNVQVFGLLENTTDSANGLLVARLTGQFAQNVTYALSDNSNYVLQMLDSKTANVLYRGPAFDFESGTTPGFSFTATSGSGTTFQGGVTIPIVNAFEVDPVFQAAENDAYFAASEGSHWIYHFNKDFHDPEAGDVLTYSLAGGVSGLLPYLDTNYGDGDGWAFNSATGQMELWFKSDFNTLPYLGVTLNVIATDQGGNTTATGSAFTFDVWNAENAGATVTAIPSTIASSKIYTDVSNINDTATITGMNNNIFTNGGIDNITLSGGSNSGNYVHAGDGDDHFFVIGSGTSPGGNTLVGGYGHDTFTLDNAQNRIYGGDGNDTVIYKGGSLGQLNGGPIANHLADGGWGEDKLRFENSGSLNFAFIMDANGNNFKNFEIIDIKNGASNPLTLTHDSIFNLTDDRNVLKVERDANDTVTVQSQGHSYTNEMDNDGNTVIHFDTGVTLLVEPGAATVSVV